MNAPQPLMPLAVPDVEDTAARLREIRYNYTSLSDREIVLRLLGVRVGKLARMGAPEAVALPSARGPASTPHRAAEPPAPFEGTLDLF